MNFRFRDLREDAGLAQKEVAAMLKCDQSLYSKYERGVREMPMRDVIFLAKYYNVSVDYLLGLTPVQAPFPKRKEEGE
ncbi:helix-turn-helix domain-containing protein [Provencibacterium massiliense]|uniref:helix-turn-helix domain-containing protein n=1 Tax=Provencibacterium massiliense TaxID=1841868 RepID=UPI0009A6E88F|nr:helix-turn-helix transcriptional regulator [Provencibacterium massiliense]RGB66730.1 XRE family transcriptional regulator [Harryflintia acetispora]